MRWTRAGRAALVLATTFALVGACSSGSEGDGPGSAAPAGANGIAVADEVLRPAGTPLADGLEVQDGSWLVARTFPVADLYADPAATVEPHGWQAVLTVDERDAVGVWDRYVEAFGFAPWAGARQACIVIALPPEGSEPHDLVARLLVEPRLDQEAALSCTARTESTELAMRIGWQGCPIDSADAGACQPRPAAHLFVRVARPLGPPAEPWRSVGTESFRFQRTSAEGQDDDAARAEIEVPVADAPIVAPDLVPVSGPSRLPAAGDRVDDGFDHFLGQGSETLPLAVLPEGSRSLVAPAMVIDCNGGLVAVVSLPGTPTEAVLAAERRDDGRRPVRGSFDGEPFAGFARDSAGGYYLDTVALPGPDGTSVAFVTECGD